MLQEARTCVSAHAHATIDAVTKAELESTARGCAATFSAFAAAKSSFAGRLNSPMTSGSRSRPWSRSVGRLAPHLHLVGASRDDTYALCAAAKAAVDKSPDVGTLIVCNCGHARGPARRGRLHHTCSKDCARDARLLPLCSALHRSVHLREGTR
eukprot:Amastigsp_a677433_19.p2 type:complete len:154 gc:universal Amastigsp_a677433_19:558-1019(+)